jgi:hypothetical protein
MRKLMLLSAAVLVCAALAVAQDTPSAGQAGQSSSTTTTQTTTTQTSSGNAIQGCLTGTTGNYTLTDATGVAYKVQGDESQFADNLNKEVEVMGTVGSSASASAGNSPDNSASSQAGSDQGSANATAGGSSGTSTGATATANASKTLEVSSVKKVANTCGGNK